MLSTNGQSDIFYLKLGEDQLPDVFSYEAGNITVGSASIAGQVNTGQGSTVTSRGICYSTSLNATTADFVVTAGSGAGSFTATLTGLDPNLTYYARAFATGSAGTIYGNEISFKTLLTGARELEQQNRLKAWPNPFRDEIIIDLADVPVPKPFSVYNVQGKITHSGFLKTGINMIPANQLSPGLYFLKTDGKHCPLKLIKE